MPGRSQDDFEPVELEDVAVKKVLDKSLLCVVNEKDIFIPKTEIRDHGDITAESEEGDEGTLIIPKWLAEDRGIEE